eukprot:366023-Chlamydomonas_euryale.AAC.6
MASESLLAPETRSDRLKLKPPEWIARAACCNLPALPSRPSYQSQGVAVLITSSASMISSMFDHHIMASLVEVHHGKKLYGVPLTLTLTVRSHEPWLQTVQRATLLHGMCVHDADLRHHQRAARALAFAVTAERERRFKRTTVPGFGLSTSHWHVGIGKRGGGSPTSTRGSPAVWSCPCMWKVVYP